MWGLRVQRCAQMKIWYVTCWADSHYSVIAAPILLQSGAETIVCHLEERNLHRANVRYAECFILSAGILYMCVCVCACTCVCVYVCVCMCVYVCVHEKHQLGISCPIAQNRIWQLLDDGCVLPTLNRHWTEVLLDVSWIDYLCHCPCARQMLRTRSWIWECYCWPEAETAM